ncbi:alpha/beta hydrolase [Fulvivirgaceae bacterium PWU5]|uniref:Alpha/beta hydrolase n=1 Tax=Dawidia cretensis TaxID=2782350 RepID=A0AAP2E0B4_9BACT|nr:alpha/beta hydrolase [Dawidia cretensis]MBT1709297.1 alpha/beta hydrolase [Dawidia cretensis]
MTSNALQAQQNTVGRYAIVNGLKLYYELHGTGKPLVLLHGGGSTIESNFARVLPALARTHQVIAIELQAHGHTADIDRSFSFEQDADDVSALLQHLHIEKADILGFSNGGTTALQVAIRHPKQVNKLVLASTLYKRDGMPTDFFEFMQQTTLEQMPAPLKEAYRKVNADPQGLQKMFTRDATRMIHFQDISDDLIKAIQAPALVINGDTDVIRVEHALLLSRTLPHAELAILPGGHSDYIGEICAAEKNSKLPDFVVMMIDTFLAK